MRVFSRHSHGRDDAVTAARPKKLGRIRQFRRSLSPLSARRVKSPDRGTTLHRLAAAVFFFGLHCKIV